MSVAPKRFSGNIPEYYHRHLVPLLFQPYAHYLVDQLTDVGDGPLLEVACGTGALTRQLRDHLPPDVDIVATDINPVMLEIAKQELDDVARLKFQLADALDLNFPDSHFTTVICQFGIMFFPDKRRALSEMLRVLRPGGKVYVSTWSEQAQNHVFNRAHQAVQSLDLKAPINFMGGYSYSNADDIRSDFLATGFKQVELSTVTKMAAAPTIDFLVDGVVNGTTIASQLHEQGLLATGTQAIRDQFISAFGTDKPSGQIQALFCTATRPY